MASGVRGALRLAAAIAACAAPLWGAAQAGFAAPSTLGPPPAGAELVVEGVNPTPDLLQVWLRVDGAGSTGWESRANLLRTVPPGRFALRVAAGDLRTPRDAPLDLSAGAVARLFPRDRANPPLDAAARWEAPPTPPEGAVALDFGAADGPLFPGFRAAGPDHPGLSGRRLRAVTRPGADALARDGVAGVERLTLPLPAGRWLVRLWIEDLGAWEYVPRELRRRVRLNGRDVLDRRDSAADWVDRRWMRGAEARAQAGATAWRSFGARRAGLGPFAVEIGAEGLRLELAGDSEGALFLAGIAAVPDAAASWLDGVTAAQALRFDAAWPVDHAAGAAEMAQFGAPPAAPPPLARGETVWLRLDGGTDGAVTLDPPALNGATLPVDLRAGWRRLTRATPQAPALAPLAREFHAVDGPLPKDPLGRPLLLAVRAPLDAAPGLYRGTLRVAERTTPFAVEVIDLRLPPADASAGVYLDDPPHHAWFGTDPLPARACRLSTLAALGLQGAAPPLATPLDAAGLQAFARDLAMARAALGDGPLLAYAPLKRLFAKGEAAALAALPAAAAAGGPALLWSAADEPSNAGPHSQFLVERLDAIRAAAPGVRLAAQLNAPGDRALAGRFDAALVNAGYGLDAADFDALRAAEVEPWIYNTGPERLAAGLHGWRVGARGYLAWHGLMPTALPFDPTDGREGDAALLPLAGDPCAAVPPLDERLVRIAEGAADRRWLAWLDLRAGADPEAAALRARIRALAPATWARAVATMDAAALDAMRGRIAALARRRAGGAP
jgi:hypothetical protein